MNRAVRMAIRTARVEDTEVPALAIKMIELGATFDDPLLRGQNAWPHRVERDGLARGDHRSRTVSAT